MSERIYSEHYQNSLNEALSFSAERWRELISQWDIITFLIADMTRNYDPEERSRRAWQVYQLAQKKDSDDERIHIEKLSLIWNLPDESLAKLHTAMETMS